MCKLLGPLGLRAWRQELSRMSQKQLAHVLRFARGATAPLCSVAAASATLQPEALFAAVEALGPSLTENDSAQLASLFAAATELGVLALLDQKLVAAGHAAFQRHPTCTAVAAALTVLPSLASVQAAALAADACLPASATFCPQLLPQRTECVRSALPELSATDLSAVVCALACPTAVGLLPAATASVRLRFQAAAPAHGRASLTSDANVAVTGAAYAAALLGSALSGDDSTTDPAGLACASLVQVLRALTMLARTDVGHGSRASAGALAAAALHPLLGPEPPVCGAPLASASRQLAWCAD
jgi:hypothetical protein